MRKYAPDPKPERRVYDPKAGIAKVFSEGKCRVCKAKGTWRKATGRVADDYGLTRHHLVPRGQQGDDVDDNLVPLCGHGTAGCHGDVEARRAGARGALRRSLTPAEVDYVVSKKGRGWLDRHYPLTLNGAAKGDRFNPPDARGGA